MWAIACFDLGLSGREFGRLSYRSLGALLDRLNLRRQADDYRAGVLCALVANALGGKGRPRTPANFFPSLRGLDGADAPRKMTPRQMIAVAEMIAATQNARVAAGNGA